MNIDVNYANIPIHYIIPLVFFIVVWIGFTILIKSSNLKKKSELYKNYLNAKNNPQKTGTVKYIKKITGKDSVEYAHFAMVTNGEKTAIDRKVPDNIILEKFQEFNVGIYENNYYIHGIDEQILENMKAETKNGLVSKIEVIINFICIAGVCVFTLLSMIYMI